MRPEGGYVGARSVRDPGHEGVAAHRSSDDHPIDIADPASVSQLLDAVGTVDALACTAGWTPYGAWDDLDRASWTAGLENKLLGQVELVRQGTRVVRPGGSFTLITGILAREPVVTGSIAAAVNGALEAWVVASAQELWGRYRINAVSPTVLTESREKYASVFPGYPLPEATSSASSATCSDTRTSGSSR